ncbi:MAG: hypothetical protein FJ029_15830, partial [Actinobacteria bacterium]|nr:hypothetical protein [Actinomycetota bacterium]
MRAGRVEEAVQRAVLEIDVSGAAPVAVTAAVHFIGVAARYAAQDERAAATASFDAALDALATDAGADDLRPQLYQNVAAALAGAGDHAGAAECLA